MVTFPTRSRRCSGNQHARLLPSGLPVFVAAFLLLSAAVPLKAPPKEVRIRDVEFAQLDWTASDGTVVHDTLWGQITWSSEAAPNARYLNVTLLLDRGYPGSAAWVIQNLPLLEHRHKVGEGLESAYFDIAELGLQAGEDLASVCHAATLSHHLLTTPPGPPDQCVPVQAFLRVAIDDPNLTPGDVFDPGSPEPIKLTSEPTKLAVLAPLQQVKDRDIKPVQESNEACMSGAMARSLDWLNREHKLGSKKTAQQIYNDLVAAGVSQPARPGESSADAEARRIEAKDKYAKRLGKNKKIETKVWDSGAEVSPVPGVGESGGDFKDWFLAEMKAGEDVEIAYKTEKLAHIVTVAGVSMDKKGNLVVKYRDDAQQQDFNGGDNAIKNAKVYKGADGSWRFGADKFLIHFAVSESVTKQETPTTTPSNRETPPPENTPTPTRTQAPPSPTRTPPATNTPTPTPRVSPGA